MEKKLVMLLILIALSCPAYAENDLWFYTSSYLILEPTIKTEFDVVSKPGQLIEYVVANITFFPKQTNTQAILESYYTPQPKMNAEELTFEWEHPSPGNIGITIRNKVKTLNKPTRVKTKVGFPIETEDIPPEYAYYTKPSEIIDTNNKIVRISSELASGESDLYRVVDKVGVWVNKNINYNLSTVTSEAAQKSSWVLDNREGVCDELTSLFISMLRSLGIPARFVSGVSYTNLEIFGDKWGPHGWAEVYFPGYGWVPYDVTYGEYGWVDPAHIVAKVADDAGKFTSRYTWRAEQGVSLDIGKLDTDVKVIEKGKPISRSLEISVSPMEDDVGFGSYTLVTATVRNLADYYQSFDVYVSRTTRLNYTDDHQKHVLLEPYGERIVTWTVQVDDDLDRDFIYSFPVVAYTLDNHTAEAKFNALADAPHYSLDRVTSVAKQYEVEDALVYSKNVKMNCSLDKREYYDYEDPAIGCIIKNAGNVFLTDMKICLDNGCVYKDMGITEETGVNFTANKKILGLNELKITADDEDVSKVAYLAFNVLDQPKIGIDDIEYPRNATYGSMNKLRFRLVKESGSNSQDVVLKARINRKEQMFDLGEMDGDKDMEIIFRGKDLGLRENNITLSAGYKDMNGREYRLDESYPVSLINPNWFQKLMILLRTVI